MIAGESFVLLGSGARVHVAALTLVDELITLGHEPRVDEDGALSIKRSADLREDVRYMVETLEGDIIAVLCDHSGRIHSIAPRFRVGEAGADRHARRSPLQPSIASGGRRGGGCGRRCDRQRGLAVGAAPRLFDN